MAKKGQAYFEGRRRARALRDRRAANSTELALQAGKKLKAKPDTQ